MSARQAAPKRNFADHDIISQFNIVDGGDGIIELRICNNETMGKAIRLSMDLSGSRHPTRYGRDYLAVYLSLADTLKLANKLLEALSIVHREPSQWEDGGLGGDTWWAVPHVTPRSCSTGSGREGDPTEPPTK